MKCLIALIFVNALMMLTVQANEAEDLLQRMQSAVQELTYNGQLAYSRGGELSTYRISHQPGNGANAESIVRLDQSNTNQRTEQFSLVNFSYLNLQDQQVYSIDLGGYEQVAGHTCRIVVARPKDKLRYLHRYCIATDNDMLLKYSLMDRQQNRLEQLIFTHLKIIDVKPAKQQFDIEVALPQLNGMGALGLAASSSEGTFATEQDWTAEFPTEVTMEATTELQDWDFSYLPPGFEVIKVVPEEDVENAHQVVLSDGMVSISIFIAREGGQSDSERLYYNNGATNILVEEVAGHTITLLGEVPLSTLRTIKKGLRYIVR